MIMIQKNIQWKLLYKNTISNKSLCLIINETLFGKRSNNLNLLNLYF